MLDWPSLERILNAYGIALAVLVAFVVLVGRGILRWGPGVDAEVKRLVDEHIKAVAKNDADHAAVLAKAEVDRTAEMAFREQLRLEERAGRLEAEGRLDEALEVAKQATDLASRYERIVRGQFAEQADAPA